MASAPELIDQRAFFAVSGTQGAGKSTVARLLAQRFARGVHVEADVLQRMIVAGARWPEAPASGGEDAFPEDVHGQLRLRLHHACVLGRSFFDAGFTVVVDDIIVGARLDQLCDELAGQPFTFVMLTPDLATVRRREAGRGTDLYEKWEWLDDSVRSTRRLGIWVDSSHQTPDATVDEILARRRAGAT